MLARCWSCYAEADIAEFLANKRCPRCQFQHKPLNPEKDARLHMNWEELRMLFFWANQWVKSVGPNSPQGLILTKMAERLKHCAPPDSQPLDPLGVPSPCALALISRKGEICPIQRLDKGNE